MPALRFSAAAALASLAAAGLMLSTASAFAAGHHHHRHHVRSDVIIYSDAGAYYEGNEAVFPNTEDHSSECVNGYRWQRHNHDWYKTEAQDSVPLRCY